jgi:hypothetical protein
VYQATLVTGRTSDLFCFTQGRVLLFVGAARHAQRQAAGWIACNVAHFHQTHLSMMNVAEGPPEISVAQDQIVFNLSELTGSIWAGEFR